MQLITVLKCGGEYNESHVAWIVNQLPGYDVYCISDSLLDQKRFFETTGAHKIELRYNAWGGRGWWAKMELFRPEIKGDFLYFDLDTVFIDIEKIKILIENNRASGNLPIVLSDFYFPTTSIGSGLMYLPENCRTAIWDKWIRDPDGNIARNHGDQDFLTPWLWNALRWQNLDEFAVISYKAHLSPDDGQQFYRRGYDDFSKIKVVCFHGFPRPWEASARNNHDWIPK